MNLKYEIKSAMNYFGEMAIGFIVFFTLPVWFIPWAIYKASKK